MKQKIRLTEPNELIDAVEVGEDFVTVYLNTHKPGLPESIQDWFINRYRKYLANPSYHDPERFHKGDHPRGSNWRTWEHKYACHFHLLGDPNEILAVLECGPNLREKINETFHD